MSPNDIFELDKRGHAFMDEFRKLSHYIHIREHAMMALIPILPHLSRNDSKKLIYACFIDEDFSRGCNIGFTFEHFFSDDLPCCKETPSTPWFQSLHAAHKWVFEDRWASSSS